MKKLILILSLFFLMSDLAFSQKSEFEVKLNPRQRAEKMTDKFSELLKLSDNQRMKINDLLLERENTREQNRIHQTKEKAEKRKKAIERKNTLDNQLKSILSDEQYNKLLVFRKEKLQKRKSQGNLNRKSKNDNQD